MIYLIPIFLSLWGLMCYKNKTSPHADRLYWFICISIILIFGLRYRVGGDTLNYILKYERIPPLSLLSLQQLTILDIEPGFIILSGMAKEFFNSFYVVQIVESCLVNITIFYYAKKHIGSNFLFVLFFFIFQSFYFNTEIMREGCAVSFFLIGLLQYEKGKLKFFYLWMIPAVIFHFSSLFFLLYPIFNKYITKPQKTLWYGLLAMTILNIFSLPIFSGYLGTKIVNSSVYKFSLWGQLFVLIKYIIFPYVILMYVKTNKKYCKNLDIQKFLSVYIFFGMLSLSPYSILMRLMNYLNPVFLVIVVFCFSSSYKWSINTMLFKGFTLGCFFFFYLSPYLKDTSTITPGTHYHCLWFPYYSIFDEQEDNNRETFVRAQFDAIHERND